MTRRAIPLLLAAALLAAVPAGASERDVRREEMSYEPTDDNHSFGLPGAGPGPQIAGEKYTFELHKGERFVSVEIVDDGEMMVASAIAQWDYGEAAGAGGASAQTGRLVMVHHFCGYTEEPVRVNPKYDFDVWIKNGTCEDGTPSVPTSGRILAEIHRR